MNAQQCELISNSWDAPDRIVTRDLPDEFSDLKRNLRSPGSLRSGEPSPIEPEALMMPFDHGVGLDNNEA